MQQRDEVIYRYNRVFWTKYFTGLDLLDFSECNDTKFVGKPCDPEPALTQIVSYIGFLRTLLACL